MNGLWLTASSQGNTSPYWQDLGGRGAWVTRSRCLSCPPARPSPAWVLNQTWGQWDDVSSSETAIKPELPPASQSQEPGKSAFTLLEREPRQGPKVPVTFYRGACESTAFGGAQNTHISYNHLAASGNKARKPRKKRTVLFVVDFGKSQNMPRRTISTPAIRSLWVIYLGILQKNTRQTFVTQSRTTVLPGFRNQLCFI